MNFKRIESIMPVLHLLLVILVMFIWGVNFIFVKIGLQEISPLLLCARRFLLAGVPAIFFIKKPDIPIKVIVLYGVFMFGLQFSFVFWGMCVGMTPGMASLIMQVQIFFSIFFAALFYGERPQWTQIVGAVVAFSGIAVVTFHFDKHVSLFGFLCLMVAAASWAVGNLVAKKVGTKNLLSVVVWGSFFICIPMFIVAYIVEGPERFVASYHHLTWNGIGALMYIVYLSTCVGYGAWNWLLARYPVNVIVPFSLLVPLVGIVSSVIVFGEAFQLWKLVACLLVISGLCINIFSARFLRLKVDAEAA